VTNLRLLIEKYLEKAILLQIATTSGNVPWVCTVCFAYDTHLNFYWFSRHATRHSKEIANNPRVAGAVVLPYKVGKKTRGLQFAGKANELRSATDIAAGLAALSLRYKTSKERESQITQQLKEGAADYGLYRLRPDSIILYDTLNFPNSPRQVYVVPKKKVARRTVRSRGRGHR